MELMRDSTAFNNVQDEEARSNVLPGGLCYESRLHPKHMADQDSVYDMVHLGWFLRITAIPKMARYDCGGDWRCGPEERKQRRA